MTDVIGTASAGFERGFADQRNEISIESLEVTGAVPGWLSGTLVRNGPAQFRVGDLTLNHWFDGLAMLHAFDIAGGRVGYANRFLDSPSRRAAADGTMAYSAFATDPCRSLFGRFAQLFAGSGSGANAGANANVSVGRVADRFVAQTETPLPVAFDPRTLETLGVVRFDDELRGQLTTAHPHHDAGEGAAYNYLTTFGRTSVHDVYRLRDGSRTRERLGRTTSRRPSYMHSFALSERYAVLMEFPLVVNPLRLLVRGRPFIENFRWEPERGTRFTLVDRRTGEVRHAHTDEAWFGFHHVNAVDGEDGVVEVDLFAYPSADVVRHFYLDTLLDGRNDTAYPRNELRRFTVSATTGEVSSRTLVDHPAELPRINYAAVNGRPYRHVWANGIADPGGSAFLDTIVKADVVTGGVEEWRAEGHFPGEPVFVPRPEALTEDDGVLLTVVLDATRNTSYLLLLDARDLTEIARAHVPQHVPFGFHGAYLGRDAHPLPRGGDGRRFS